MCAGRGLRVGGGWPNVDCPGWWCCGFSHGVAWASAVGGITSLGGGVSYMCQLCCGLIKSNATQPNVDPTQATPNPTNPNVE